MERFHELITQVFPGAVPEDEFVPAVMAQSLREGFKGSDTIFGDCTCRDENQRKIIRSFAEFYGEDFQLGALAALPGVGIVGTGAYVHHSPDEKKLAVLFLPHIGYDAEHGVGAVYRPGQSKHSTSCGALVGFLTKYKRAVEFKEEFVPCSKKDDHEQHILETSLLPYMDNIMKAENPLIALTEKTYDIGLDMLLRKLETHNEDYIIFSGIHINTSPENNDYIIPKQVIIRKQGDINSKDLDLII